MDNDNRLSCGTAVLLLGAVALIVVLVVKDAGLSDWAAWVQALGSIGAIWWAYRTAEKQFERELERRREDLIAKDEAGRREQTAQLEIVVAIAVDCIEALHEFQNYAYNHLDGNRFQLRPARLEDAQYALRGLMVRTLPPGVATPILDLQRSVSRTLRDAERYYANIRRPDEAMQDVIYGRSLRAMRDAQQIPGFIEAWQQRQEKSAWPSDLIAPPYRDDSIK